jgi:pectin methylesterase-like acyl-CoA thioesterase
MQALSSSAVQAFTSQSDQIFSQAKLRAAALPANTVQVWPGGTTFTTIQAAIDSITGAGPQVQYQVAVGPGTYNENVVMKDYVYVIGTEQDQTFITAPAQQQFGAGVVNSASNCGISDLTINASGGGWGACPVGIKITGSGPFHAKGVTINTTDGGTGGNNIRGITNNTGSYAGNVIVGDCIINATGVSESTAVGIELFGMSGLTMFINVSTISVTGASQNFGVSTAVNATVTIDASKIIAATWALYDSDGTAQITANQCTISGPVSSGVVVNN